MPSKVLRVLRAQLGESEYRYCGAMTQQGVFEVALYFRRGQYMATRRNLVPKSSAWWFDLSECKAWSLDCCWDALAVDTQLWARRLTETEGRFIFGDKRLPHDLLNEAKAVGGMDGET